ncbi:MAG: hypothetical protein NW206_19400 [Hyphomonadaceae bacterium]|nr:hypothetical protein [Hyphomonadaceae bacterium]
MEALIVAAFILLAIVLVEASYAIFVSLVRWAPVIIVGALGGWLAHRHGADAYEVLGVALLAAVVTRHLMRARADAWSLMSGSYDEASNFRGASAG